jgi:rsbT co-antagonist protein RsbR
MPNDQLKPDQHLLQITEYDVERRKRFVDLQPDDLARIAASKDLVLKHVDEHAAAFFDYLSKLEEAADLFNRRELFDEAKRRKHDHLIAMVEGDYGESYVEQRLQLGLLYSRARLDPRVFLGAFHHMMRSIGTKMMARWKSDAETGFEHFISLKKVAFFDIGIIIDTMIADREGVIRRQQDAIRELSTPTLQFRDRLLILPIIGVLDSYRAKQLTEGLLRAIRANRAKVVVMDITGVATVDSKVANHLIQTVAAAQLMGAAVVMTGLSPEVAQSLVTLGVDVGKLNAIGDLQGGIEAAERMLGYEIVRRPAAAGHGASAEHVPS